MKILIGIPTAKYVESETFKSIYRLEKPAGVTVDFECFHGYRVDQVRNLMAHYVISRGYDSILFVDSDIVLPKNTLVRLLEAKKDIVSGVYRQRFLDRVAVEAQKYKQGGPAMERMAVEDIQGEGLLEAAACGFGCVLISRKALETIGYPQFEYHPTIDFAKSVSEDTDFCIKAKKKGLAIWLDPTIKCGHIGDFVLSL